MSIILEWFICSVLDFFVFSSYLSAQLLTKKIVEVLAVSVMKIVNFLNILISVFWFLKSVFAFINYGKLKTFWEKNFLKFLSKNCNNIDFLCRHLIIPVSKHPTPIGLPIFWKCQFWIIKLHPYKNLIFWVTGQFHCFWLQVRSFLIMKLNAS